MPQLRLERGAPAVTLTNGLSDGIGRADGPEKPYGKLKPGPGRSPAEVTRHQRVRIHRAMVDVVAERGYDAATVREIARTAGVSTRTFYKHYSSKQDCFWGVHQLVIRRLIRSIGVAQVGARDGAEALHRTIHAVARGWSGDPRAARLMLVDAHLAESGGMVRTRKAQRSILERAEASLDGMEGIARSPLLAEGIVAGLVGVARARLLDARDDSLDDLGEVLPRWAVRLVGSVWTEVSEFELGLEDPAMRDSSRVPPRAKEGAAASITSGEVSVVLSAISKLAANEEHECITLNEILNTAGVSRRCFLNHFASIEVAFAAAARLHATYVLAQAREAAQRGRTPAGEICQAISAICMQAGQRPAFAQLCLGSASMAQTQPMRCAEWLKKEVGSLIEERAPSASPAQAMSLEASVQALFGVLQTEVRMGRSAQVPRLVGALAYFVLAPLIGPSDALKTLRFEAASTSTVGSPSIPVVIGTTNPRATNQGGESPWKK